jgi:hypothetical protein
MAERQALNIHSIKIISESIQACYLSTSGESLPVHYLESMENLYFIKLLHNFCATKLNFFQQEYDFNIRF